jgi:hypothetical protein
LKFIRFGSFLILLVIAQVAAVGLAQSAESRDGTCTECATLPEAPQPKSQTPDSALAAVVSYSTSLNPGSDELQDPQSRAPDEEKSEKVDTLKKPIQQNPVNSGQPPQTKRILGIIPNFRSVSTDVKLPPQTVKEKFLTATDDSFDYSSIFIPALLAAYSMGENATPEFGQGAVGYGRYFWHSALDQTSENYVVEFVVPAVTHEDNRYYTLGRGGFVKRTGYALSRVVITRSDSAHSVFNFGEVVGAGASAGISSFYYPSRERSFANTATEWGLDIGIDAASFVAKEFWPDINRKLFHSEN